MKIITPGLIATTLIASSAVLSLEGVRVVLGSSSSTTTSSINNNNNNTIDNNTTTSSKDKLEVSALDLFQRCAIKALAGDYGQLQPWQRYAYARGLVDGVKATKLLVLTQYNAKEGRFGQVDRRGQPCTKHTCASNRLPYGCYVWTNKTGLRQVRDCGASRNDTIARRIAQKHGHSNWRNAIWIDVWYPNAQKARAAGLTGWHPTKGAVIAGR